MAMMMEWKRKKDKTVNVRHTDSVIEKPAAVYLLLKHLNMDKTGKV